ncbi:MAG: DEAD/DEAH box helicase [Bacteroidales bacterium]|jgi:ATP-dependent exoDNAse (exonuclease V) alpha subunit|nr:DEAD/DEAH box helicase [Bacteroidales bacterium]
MTQDYFDFKLTAQQSEAVSAISNYINSSDHNIFILTGYAGTGKTSLLKGLSKLFQNEYAIHHLASTGRAAKVLSGKTGMEADTIHRVIYQHEITVIDRFQQLIKVTYKIRTNNAPEKSIYFIDESSMISDKKSLETDLNFGTGKLLSDLLKYVGNRKLIFIGDKAQLPPVKFDYSPALSVDYIQRYHKLNVATINLTEVVRIAQTTGIYKNSEYLRNVITANQFSFLTLNMSHSADITIHISIDAMTSHFTEIAPKVGIDNLIFITASNKAAHEINLDIRNKLYGRKSIEILQKNEVLMVIQNNYYYNLMNGDAVSVSWISKETRQIKGIIFRDIEIMYDDPKMLARRVEKVKIIENTLTSNAKDLLQDIDYKLRQYAYAKAKSEGIDTKNKAVFIEYLKNEPFVNALRIKYGYAATCHKAQGGEWTHVFTMLEMWMFYQTKSYLYRWAYTAITRSSEHLHILNNNAIR